MSEQELYMMVEDRETDETFALSILCIVLSKFASICLLYEHNANTIFWAVAIHPSLIGLQPVLL